MHSIWPSSGAQYHWTAELSPPKFRGVFVRNSEILKRVCFATILTSRSLGLRAGYLLDTSGWQLFPVRWVLGFRSNPT